MNESKFNLDNIEKEKNLESFDGYFQGIKNDSPDELRDKYGVRCNWSIYLNTNRKEFENFLIESLGFIYEKNSDHLKRGLNLFRKPDEPTYYITTQIDREYEEYEFMLYNFADNDSENKLIFTKHLMDELQTYINSNDIDCLVNTTMNRSDEQRLKGINPYIGIKRIGDKNYAKD